ncbi:unnamed protein product [Tilletia controversa]|uniref:Uncharacterized protein n=3 Tax=Tilletia TaxID=13289 RepID=A0A8X7N0Y5_9BASI|nr:hypothetical protein CF336_g5732 [Tilletia laevis]KAE8204411.1 hypothetical protein CF328_g1088 [Tilletia controversa]KAE8256805.1 hypothetical protein A4X03_0g5040 [Tilletia caries]KAE8195943.1 hypothetical protein CF335_g4973 [Tilletia laevis]KAE8256062.1 hypothetical protein A4X06_0g98 [Tilletia controversa]
MRRPQFHGRTSSTTPSSFLSSLRSLSFDEIQDLPASIAAKQAAVESNLSRLAVQHIDSVLDARNAVASLPAFRASLRHKLERIQSVALPELNSAVGQLPAQAQPAILKHQHSDTLAKTIADEESLTLLLYAPVTVKNLVSAATAGGALLGPTTAASASAPNGPASPLASDALAEERALDGSPESGSQAASAALSITMRLYALATEGSVLLSSSTPNFSNSRLAQRADAEALGAAHRSLHSIATEALMHLHNLKVFLIRRSLHDVHLKLADAIRVVTMIRHMRNLRPQAISGDSASIAGIADVSRPQDSALDELGMSESHLMLAFFQARTSALRSVLDNPVSMTASQQPTTSEVVQAFSDLLAQAESGATTACITLWMEQVSRTIAISKAIFEPSQTQQTQEPGAAGYKEAQELLPLLRSSFCTFAVRLLSDMLEEKEDDTTIVLRRPQQEGTAPQIMSRARRKSKERITMALHLYTYSLQ